MKNNCLMNTYSRFDVVFDHGENCCLYDTNNKKYIDFVGGIAVNSLGYKQRLALACALMHKPPVLFLDEPTSGVDPIARKEFWSHIKGLSKKGVTVMVTTHFMDEAEYCDRISLFYKGETIATGTPLELKEKANAKNMEEAFSTLIENKIYDE